MAVKETGQYALALIVIASMLIVTNVPVFVVFFFGIFAFFVLKLFAGGSRSDTREIFEFYLTANEILRDDDRRWYGFEIKDALDRGESLLQRMSAPPPLLRFAVGALYHKLGEHKSAIGHLSQVLEKPSADELAYVFPTPELRNYVKVLRKIEREPGDAPMTSAAVRALERARKIRGKALLEGSRNAFANAIPARPDRELSSDEEMAPEPQNAGDHNIDPAPASVESVFVQVVDRKNRQSRKKDKREEYTDRQPITDLLHDIYDKNVN